MLKVWTGCGMWKGWSSLTVPLAAFPVGPAARKREFSWQRAADKGNSRGTVYPASTAVGRLPKGGGVVRGPLLVAREVRTAQSRWSAICRTLFPAMKRSLLLLLSLLLPLGCAFSATPDPASFQPSTAALDTPGLNTLPAANAMVIQQIGSMPSGGGYSASHNATELLKGAVRPIPQGFGVNPVQAQPSYCSGATYLVFLKTLNALQHTGFLSLDVPTTNALLINGQRDGEGIWGRWNANGPGTARLFHELDLGTNFTDFTQALPGDFMKIFWTQAVGRREHGHSVVYLGTEKVNAVESVKFWSSNVGSGYSVKTVPRSKISFAIFSRLTTPRNLARAATLSPRIDPYLAGLLTKDSNFTEVQTTCGL